VSRLLDHIHPSLKESGDLTCVEEYVNRVLTRGTGADRLRGAYHNGNLVDVVQYAIEETRRDTLQKSL
jgi:hypothetical protein